MLLIYSLIMVEISPQLIHNKIITFNKIDMTNLKYNQLN